MGIMTRPAVNRQGFLWSTCVEDKNAFGWLPTLAFDVKSPGHMLFTLCVQDLQNYDI